MPTHIFLSFAKADSDNAKYLLAHLSPLIDEGNIEIFSSNDYQFGEDIATQNKNALHTADYFLACMTSHYWIDEDCKKLLTEAQKPIYNIKFIPILFSYCDWKCIPFENILPLPESKNFIFSEQEKNKDKYCYEVAQNIKQLIAQTPNTSFQNTESYTNFNATLLDKNDNNMLIGRRADYEKLIAALSPNKPTNIKGIAGIGKTTLVNFYLSQNETKKRFPTVHRIVLADSRQEQKMNRSIAENTDYQMNTLYEALFLYFLDKIEFGDADHETKLHKIAQYLAQNGKNTLLILDNADSYQDIDRNFAFLRKTNCTILITSRNYIQGTNEIVIEKVSLPAAKTMFAAYNPTPYPPEKIESLLQNIDCHTLLIELCAKQLYEGADINIEELITAAAQYDFSVLTASHIVLSDDTYIETALDKFILYLFRPDTLTENEQQVLRYFSLLRNVEYPLDKLVQWFTNNDDIPFTEKLITNLKSLSKQGWLQIQETLQGTEMITTYQCHLIVSYAIRKLLVPTTDNCISFLENIKIEGHYYETEHIIDRIQYLPELLQITTIFSEEKAIIADILLSIRNFYKALGDYSQALVYNLQALNIHEKVFGKEHPNTATTYNNIAGVYYYMNDYSHSLDYYQKAINIKEKLFNKEYIDIDITYSSIGAVYSAMNNSLKALEYNFLALVIQEKEFGNEHLYTAITYNNIAVIYHNIKDYSQALEYYQKVLAIFEKEVGKKHLDTATVYNNLACLYEALQEYEKALTYIELAITIIEKKLPETHRYKIDSVKTRESIKEKMREK